jgi:carbon monoxide dehydrogenase subunit G
LAGGDAVARIVEEEGPGGRVLAAIDIAAPASVVWGVMLDCDRAPHYVPGLQSCAILERAPDGRSDVREHRIRWISILPTLRLRFRSEYEKERSIRVMRIGGDLAAMQGAWVLEPRENGRVTRLHYDFHLAPRTPVPKGMIRAGMLRDAPKVLEAVRTEISRVSAQ